MKGININADIKSRMRSGMTWSFTGTAFAKFLTLIAGIVCAHILTKEEYGEFNMVRSTVNMFVIFGSAGLGVTATKYVSEYKASQINKIPRICYITRLFGYFTGSLCTIAIIILAPFVATNILHCAGLSLSLKIGAILLFFSVVNGVQNGIISGFENFKAIAINTLAGSIFESIFMLVGAYFWHIEGAILGFGLGFIVIYVTNRSSIHKLFNKYNLKHETAKRLNHEDWRILFSYSLPAALSSLLIAPTFWLIRTLLVRKCGFGELAIYEAADQWKVIILFIPTAISQIVLPLLSSLTKEKEGMFKNTLEINILVIGFVSLIISLIVIIASPFIMNLYGAQFNDYTPLRVLALSTIFSAIANILEMTAYSMGKMWQCFIINIVWAIGMVAFTKIFLINGMGASALSFAVLFAYILSCTIFALYTYKLIKGRSIAR